MTASRGPLTSTLSASELIDEAHEAMGVMAVESALEGLAEVRQRVQVAAISPRGVAQTIVAELLSGGSAADDMADRLGEAVASSDRHGAVLEWLDHVRTSLVDAAGTTRATGLDDGLAVLRPRLVAVLDEARPAVAALGSATTADEAVDLDVVPAWREVTRLAADHDTIRTAQRRLTVDSSSRSERTNALADVYGYVERPDEHADIARYMEHVIDHVRRAHALTGAAVDSPTLPWLAGTPADRLRFACRADVEPWCPTWAQMLAAESESQARRADEGAQGAPRPRQGRDDAPGAYGRGLVSSGVSPRSLMSSS